MKTFSNIFIVISLLSATCIGCTKFVQIDPPTTALVTASVFNNNAAATAAQVSIYAQMNSNAESANMAIYLGLLSDELTNYNNTSGSVYTEYYTNALTASQGPGPWNNGYKYIYQANAIITALQGNSSLSSAVSQQLLGEAKFIRAFWFFYLINLYGDIPLVTTTDFTVNATISRTAKALVYQQIISDLKDAKAQMNANYIDNSDTVATKLDRTRPNKGAATALLARAYLYENKYDSAEMEATSVIGDGTVVGVPNTNNGLYGLVPSLDSVFLVNSKEAIWQMGIPLPTNNNTLDGALFILVAAPGAGSCCAISPELLNSFEPNDSRRINWIDSFNTSTTPVVTYYYPYKYKVRASTTVTEDVMMLRLAEQYLIRAEARTHLGDLAGAVSDINVIRTRAGLAPLVVGVNTNNGSILSQILHERKVELFTEWGHRWLDLIRTNSADSVMSIVTPTIKGSVWSTDDHQLLFPIPQSERVNDFNLTQNLGY